MVEVVLAGEAQADVTIESVAGSGVETVTASETLSLPAGRYRVSARRVMEAGSMVGAAYQPAIEGSDEVCVGGDEAAALRVVYTREPGSARMWLTQNNGSGAQVMAFDANQLMEAGEQTPSVGLETGLPNVGPVRVDALGRLWIGSTSGSLVAFDTARLGESSSEPPDVVIEGPAICGATIPCGPRSIAFDSAGALWVGVHSRIVKLAPESLRESGEPEAEVTITSPEIGQPDGLAFDAEGNLWVAESDGGLLKFAASRLTADIVDGVSDVAIYAQQPPPVNIGLGSPEGLVFDADGNLWVGYFAANNLVRFTPSELAVSHDPIIPTTFFTLGALALVTDLAIDEAGNLWMPASSGEIARIDRAELSAETPTVVTLQSAEIGSVVKLTPHAVTGGLFIVP